MADRSNQRLKAVLNAFPSQTQQFQWKQILILPDDGKVAISPSPTIPSQPSQLSTSIALDGTIICSYNVLPRSLRLVISSIGTQFEDSADHVPAFPVLEVLPPSAIDSNGSQVISIADAWAAIYALHTLYHAQETIPVILSPLLANHDELTSYILNSGLGRRKHVLKGLPSDPELFLSRETFWQGGGTGGYHTKGWLRGSRALQGAAPFPRIPSFTRTPSAVTPHPLRPPKPQPGEPVYRKYCPLVGEMIEFTYVDLSEGSNGEVGKHLAAFHKWHNDPRVNRGWGESGPLEKHVAYLQNVMDDPGVLPMIMSWSGELMGYTEITWIKV